MQVQDKTTGDKGAIEIEPPALRPPDWERDWGGILNAPAAPAGVEGLALGRGCTGGV